MDETQDTMNLDLNLGPVVHPDDDDAENETETMTMNLEEWLEGPVQIIREAFRHRDAVRRRSGQRWRSGWGQGPTNHETRNIATGSAGGGLEMGEGSVAAEGGPNDMTKTCENGNGFLNSALGDKKDVEKGIGDDGGVFDCNICLDLARDPVVTCCGHLFCWPCLYRWLHVHSEAKECPICKGEVTIKSVTPIYGRGNTTPGSDDPSLKIPLRPQARRIESWRQTIQRNAFTIPMEEMIRRLGSRFDLTRDLVQVNPPEGSRELPERSNLLLNRILTSRGMRREQNTAAPPDDVVDLTQTSPTNSEAGENRRPSVLLHRRSPSHRVANISHLAAWASAERIVESYFHIHNVDRNQEQIPLVDDRDSVSSIAAVIQSESQTVDTAIEIDSNISHSTSSSRRRYDASRVSDVDSGDSRALRRRRLNPN